MRDFQNLKCIDDYNALDAPIPIEDHIIKKPIIPFKSLNILRMLVMPKYGDWHIPNELEFLRSIILEAKKFDETATRIKNSFCYITIRHGKIFDTTDEWHFDGSSFRTDIIPERNYIWVNHSPTQYKLGTLTFPDDFDPVRHNLFSYAANALSDAEIKSITAQQWHLISPFCLHRRPPNTDSIPRTFIRIAFTDIEGRDVNNTQNPLLSTDAYGRDAVRTFRDKLLYYNNVDKEIDPT